MDKRKFIRLNNILNDKKFLLDFECALIKKVKELVVDKESLNISRIKDLLIKNNISIEEASKKKVKVKINKIFFLLDNIQIEDEIINLLKEYNIDIQISSKEEKMLLTTNKILDIIERVSNIFIEEIKNNLQENGFIFNIKKGSIKDEVILEISLKRIKKRKVKIDVPFMNLLIDPTFDCEIVLRDAIIKNIFIITEDKIIENSISILNNIDFGSFLKRKNIDIVRYTENSLKILANDMFLSEFIRKFSNK